MPTIEEYGPEQTTLPLKIFIILRFAWRIFFWSLITLIALSIAIWSFVGIWNTKFPNSTLFR